MASKAAMAKATAPATPALGHNKPPADEAGANLSETNAGLSRLQQQLLARAAKAPKAINSEKGAKDLAALVRELRETVGAFEAARVEQKEPYLAGGRAVDGYFKGLVKPLEQAMGRLSGVITAWQDRVEDERRRAAEKEAAEARKEAERLAKLAAKARASEEVQLQAAAAAQEFEEARDHATASSADLVRVSDEAGTITRKVAWVCEAWDRDSLDLEALRAYFTDAAIEQAIRGLIKTGQHELAGASIVEQKTAMVL